ncbi:MAG: RnfABCDGE type electron transport complex subunit D [Candidatus Cloacimonadaceae bacterium]|nr:RnfABCDGE type electron transport complex subunit D [Candidatus Cloacimonadaceae bacterium]MDP3113951.1 RnfABCDGE type electron transport complex subunit D [Candidatus Cloacimonadaceae bacterium]
MKDKLIVSPAPHLHDKTTIPNVMWSVVIALIPALIASVYYWGFRALYLTLLGAAAAVITEALIQKLRKVPIAVADGSAFLTGMLLSYNIHAGAPWWLPVMGAVFAIAVGKQVFGGLGNNPVNPALLGRAFLLASWPTLMTGGWVKTKLGSINGITNLNMIHENLQGIAPKAYDLVTSATPLKVAQTLRDSTFVNSLTSEAGINIDISNKIMNSLLDMGTLKTLFWGNIGGCIGEVSVFALLLGAAYLLWKNIIEWRIPFFYIATVFVLSFLFGGIKGSGYSLSMPFFHIFAGGLMLGAFFMATDYTTSPLSKNGRIIYAIGCGLLTVVIRLVGGYPEGVSYSILFMNVMTPLIDKMTMPKAFGRLKK